MGFFNLLGSGSSRDFYLRDFRNAYKFRPDVNPVRQKFQGYVNFVFNRDIYEYLYAQPSDGSKEFRTQISSLVKTADLPGVEFQTETSQIFEDINTSLDKLTSEPDNQVLFYRNYLYWHEIKSLATLFNLETIAKLSHEIETLFDTISKKKSTIT